MNVITIVLHKFLLFPLIDNAANNVLKPSCFCIRGICNYKHTIILT